MNAMFLHKAALFLSLFASAASAADLIPLGSNWRFLDNGSNQGSAWTATGFDDSAWASGGAELGYGDGTETTVVGYGPDPANKHVTTYFRHSFEVADPAVLGALQLAVQRDDGVVVYLNGSEVFRDNLPAGAIGHTTLASVALGGDSETALITSSVDPAFVVAGTNTIAVEIHQADRSSSDISFNLRLGSPPPPALVRGPYLQRASASQITLRWRTSTPAISVVRYGAGSDNLGFQASSPAPTTEHSVTLAGLQPASRYYYSIGDGTTTFATGAGCYFQTHPATGSAVPTRVWVLGDSGTADANAAAVRDAYVTYNGGDPRADVWLMLGDNAYNNGTDTEFQAAVFNMYPATLRTSALWSTIGNHDGYSANSDTQSGPYYEIHSLPTGAESGGVASGTEAYYSFDYGNIHFVCLDSYETNRAKDAAMATWLENDLATTGQEWIIAFWHHPPYSKGSHNSDTELEMIEMRTNFLPVLDRYGVDLVLTGHSHSYERSKLIDGHYGLSGTLTGAMVLDGGDGKPAGDGAYVKPADTPNSGTVHAVAGSSGKITAAALNHPVMVSNLVELGSMILDVDGQQLDAVFLNSNGTVRDSFTIRHESPPTSVPAAPGTLVANPLGSDQIALAWTDNSGDELGFRVERSVDSTVWNTVAASLPANTVSFTDTGLTAGTTYIYRVSAFNAYGESNPTEPVSATTGPAPPFLGSIASGETPSAGTVAGDYTMTHAADGVIQSITEMESGGKPANRYNYLSHTWRFDLPPGISSSLEAKVHSSGSTDGDAFRFEYSSDGGASWTAAFVVTSTDPGNVEFAVLGGATGGGLLVRVTDSDRAVGKRGLDSIRVDELHVRTETVEGIPPNAPGSLSAVAASATGIDLAWTDNSTDELGFEIERLGAAATDWTFLGNTARDATSFSDTTVQPNSSYSYRIRAFNASGASENSNLASATTPNEPIPDGIVLEAASSRVKGVVSVKLTWSNAASQQVEILRNGAILATVANSGTYTDQTSVKGGGSFTYQIREPGNASAVSNLVTVTY